jgi:CubicO group peptidase (beta-lactamase class C family)
MKDMGAAGIDAMQARVDRAVMAAIDGKRIVGTVILVAQDGKVVSRSAIGLNDREAGIPMREDAIFRLASLTKPIVAATALAQIERGLYGLDDPLTRFLPDFQPKLADGSVPKIAIRHLLTHTAGLQYRFILPPGSHYHAADISDGLDDNDLPIEENLRRMASVPLAFAPGTGWHYSLAIDVLGSIVAGVHGGTLADAVAHYVTGPLGMTETGFSTKSPERLAVPYADGTPEPVRMTDPHHVIPVGLENGIVFSPGRILSPHAYQSGGGGMAGTARDFLAFLEALRTGGAPILKAETMAMAAVNQVGDLPREDPGDIGWRWGFLSAVLDDPVRAATPQTPGTLQWGGAYGHTWFIDPAARLSAVILTNTAIEGVMGKFPAEIRDAIYGV